MADTIAISALPSDSSSLAPTDIIPLVNSGTTKKITGQNVLNYVNASAQIAESQVTNLTTDLASKLNLAGGTMTGALTLSGDATQALQPASFQQLNALSAGFRYKAACRVATTANLTATYSNGASGVGATLTNSGTQAALTIDGVALSVNDRVLVKDQTTQAQNGIYTVTTVGSGSTNWVLTRATDYDQSSEIDAGTYTNIGSEGTVNKNLLFQETTPAPITVGTTSLVFTTLGIINVVSPLTLSAPNTVGLNTSLISINENQVVNLTTDLNSINTSLSTLNSNKQNTSNNLDSLSVIPAANTGIVVMTNGLGTAWTTAQLTSSDSSITISNATGVSGNPSLTVASTVTPIGKHNLMISLGSMYPALSNGVTITQIQSTTNFNNYRGWSFPNGVNTFAHLQIPMPKSWNGSSLTIRPYFVTSGTSGVPFLMYQSIVRNAGDAFDVSFPSPNTDHPSVSASANALNIGSETTVPLGGSTPSYPSLVEIRIERQGSSGGDTLAQNIILVGLLLSITTNAGNDA